MTGVAGRAKEPEESRVCCSSTAVCPWASYGSFLVPSSPSEKGADADIHTPRAAADGADRHRAGGARAASRGLIINCHPRSSPASTPTKPKTSSASSHGHRQGKPRVYWVYFAALGDQPQVGVLQMSSQRQPSITLGTARTLVDTHGDSMIVTGAGQRRAGVSWSQGLPSELCPHSVRLSVALSCAPLEAWSCCLSSSKSTW